MAELNAAVSASVVTSAQASAEAKPPLLGKSFGGREANFAELLASARALTYGDLGAGLPAPRPDAIATIGMFISEGGVDPMLAGAVHLYEFGGGMVLALLSADGARSAICSSPCGGVLHISTYREPPVAADGAHCKATFTNVASNHCRDFVSARNIIEYWLSAP